MGERRGGTHKEHAVDVVEVAVLPAAVVDVVFWHRDFGSVEH